MRLAARLPGLLAGLTATADPDGAAGDMPVRRFAVPHTSASVLLRCPDRHAIRTAERQMRSTYPDYGPGPAGWTVTLLPVEPRALAPVPWAMAGAVSVDTASRIVRVRTPDGSAVFSADGHRTVIHAEPATGRIRAWTSLPPAAARSWAPELVRQAMTAQLRAAGAVHAHAAAVSVAGTDILIAGPRGCGKTTTLLACLRRLGGDLVADSRVLLSHDADGLTARPWPTPMTIPAGALLPYPELRAHLAAPDLRDGATGHTITVGPDQTGRLLAGGHRRILARPRLVLWPLLQLTPDDTARRSRTTELSPAQARQLLLRTRLFTYAFHAPQVRIADWISDPIPPTDSRPITPDLRAVVDDLVRLGCHPIQVTRDPARICEQITALLPTMPLPAAS